MTEMLCRGPGYWDGSCSSTPKSERISKLSGMTMSGERLDGRDRKPIGFSKSPVKEKPKEKLINKDEQIKQLQAENERLKEIIRASCYFDRRGLIEWLEINKVVSDLPFNKEKTIVLRMIVVQQALKGGE